MPTFKAFFHQIASKAELLDRLQTSIQHHLIGANAESPREFFLVKVARENVDILTVGIISSGIGIQPTYLIKNDRLVIGYNDEVATFCLSIGQLLKKVRLLTLFWEFLDVNSSPHVYALCETAIVAITDNGSIFWRIDTDAIADFQIIGNILHLRFADDSVSRIDLFSGKKL